jgi:hypothetical protein
MIRSTGVLILLAAPCAPVHGYEINLHEDLVHSAFAKERDAGIYADRYSAIDVQTFADVVENGNSDQPKHSMRPRGSSLKGAMAEAATVREQYMASAVKEALAGHKAPAGLYLGRILHMAQRREAQLVLLRTQEQPQRFERPMQLRGGGLQRARRRQPQPVRQLLSPTHMGLRRQLPVHHRQRSEQRSGWEPLGRRH